MTTTTAARGGRIGAGAAATVVANGGALALNLVTGIVQARRLGADGRGIVAFVVAWAFVCQFIAGIGFRDGLVYLSSTGRGSRLGYRRLAVVSSVVLGTIGFLAVQLVLELGFAAQDDRTVTIARVAMLLIPAILLHETLTGLAAARQRFEFFAFARLCQPLLFACGILVALIRDQVTVATTLWLFGGSYVVASLIIWRALGPDEPTEPVTPPVSGSDHESLPEDGVEQLSSGRDEIGVAAKFGVRAFGYNVGGVANTRLDLMVMSTIAIAADAGIYQVAVSAASVVAGLFMPLRHVAFAAAAKRGEALGLELTATMTRMTLLASTAVALPLGLAAPRLISFVYGAEFADAGTVVRVLLPGIVLWTASGVVAGGLNARDMPGRASLAQLFGAAVTVVALLILLPPFGIIGAAVASVISYTTVFSIVTVLLVRSHGVSVRSFLSPSALLADGRSFRAGTGQLHEVHV